MSEEPEPTPAPNRQPEPPASDRRAPKPRREPMKKGKRKRVHTMEDTHLRGVMHTGQEKKSTGPWLRATVFPREGGAPYTEDVDVDEGGHFSLEDSNLTYYIARGSVWQEDAVYRCLVNEGNAMTIHAHSLTGDDALSPEAINGVAWNNLWWQYDDETRPKSPWPMRGAISLGIFAAVIVGIMVWFIIDTGQALDSIRNAIDGLDLSQGSDRASTAAGEAGHQPISPGGA